MDKFFLEFLILVVAASFVKINTAYKGLKRIA